MAEYPGALSDVTGRFYTGRPAPGSRGQDFGHNSLQQEDQGHKRGFTLLWPPALGSAGQAGLRETNKMLFCHDPWYSKSVPTQTKY